MRLGMIGIGLMGHGIARNLLGRGGFPLRFLDHPGNRPVDEILALGGVAARTPAEVARDADAVILCVTGSAQVEAVLTGQDGVLSALKPGAVIVDCSTALPDSTLRMAALARAAGAEFLDAPMTRTAQAAHEGRLNLLIGGDAAVLSAMRPVLAAFTEEVFHVGPVGAGHRMKLLHNYVSVGGMVLLAEAAAHAADAGIDPARFVEVLAKGGGAGAALQRLAPFITTGDREALPFAIGNGLKDIAYYRQMAQASGAGHAVADGIEATLAQVVDDGQGDAYLPELVRILRRGLP
ncbi:MAG: NAD(P)-dependent oxidoreductase [Paracoccus sp. (in: a-proteobacteria)]|uniref:NAD(P)-dependent oxidoreductase n=1 Tax=Paracoccus sp. TaxID=267 RepID=UPI0039E36B17